MGKIADYIFDDWNGLKKRLNNLGREPVFKQGDIWWASVGQNIGAEVLGKGPSFRRPVIVLKKLSRYICIVIPLSTQEKSGTWFVGVTIHGEKQYALIYQIKSMSVYRFQKRLAQLD